MYVVEPSPRVGAPLSGLRNRALAGFRSNQRNRAACSNRITRPMRVVGMLGTSAAQRSTALGACRPAPEASGTRAAPVGSRSRQAARGRYYQSPLGAIGLPIESDARAVPGSPRRANPRSYTGWRPRPRSAWHARPAQEHPLEHRLPHRLALRVAVPDTFLQAVDEVVGHELRASVGRDEGLDVDLAVSAGLGRADFPLELPERVDVPLAWPLGLTVGDGEPDVARRDLGVSEVGLVLEQARAGHHEERHEALTVVLVVGQLPLAPGRPAASLAAAGHQRHSPSSTPSMTCSRQDGSMPWLC